MTSRRKTTRNPAAARPSYTIVLRPDGRRDDPDGARALRRALKYALRVCGLKCVSAVTFGGAPDATLPQERAPSPEHEPEPARGADAC